MKNPDYKDIIKKALFGFAFHKVILDYKQKPVDYVFLEVNKAFEEIFGLKASEIANRKASDIFPGIVRSEFNWIEFFGEIALNGGRKEMVQYFEPLEKWLKVQVYSDEKDYFSVICEDITKEKVSKVNLEQFFDISLDLFCIADTEGNFIKVNKEWENLLGYTDAELQQRKLLDFVHPDDINDTIEAVNQLSEQKKVVHFVNRFRSKDGSYRFIEWRSNPKGNLIFAAARDVTEQKKIEGVLRISKDAIENSTDAIGMSTPDGKHYYQNKAFDMLFGHVGDSPPETLYFDKQTGEEVFQTIKAGGQWIGEVKMNAKDKRVIDVFLRAYANKDESGKIISLVGIHTNITEKIRLEKDLEKEKKFLGTVFDSIQDGISVLDTNLFIVRVNKTIKKWYARNLPLEGKRCHIAYHDSEKHCEVCPTVRALESGKMEMDEVSIIHDDGKTGTLELYAYPMTDDKGSIVGVVEYVRDITNRKQVEEVLHRSEENLQITLNSIGDGVIATDEKGLIVRMNPVAEKLCGWLLAEAKGKPLVEVFNIINSETREAVRNPVDSVLKNGETVGLANHTALISKDGTEYQIADSAAPIIDNNGNVSGVVLVFANVTEDYALRKKIKQNEERYRGLFNYTIDGLSLNEIVYKDKKPVDYIILDVNPKYEKLLGIPREKAIGRFASSLYNEDPPPFLDIYAETADSGDSNSFETYDPKSNKHYYISAFSPEKGKFASVFQDITKRKKAEQELERERNQLISIFDSIDEPIYVADTSTYEILYANRMLIDSLGKNPVGGLCYKELQGVDSPCSFCTNDIIKNQSLLPYQWEYYNSVLDKTYRLHDRIIRWPDGRSVRFEIAIDITELKKVEKSLRHSEELFRTLADTTTSAIFIFKGEKFVYVNNATESITGYPKDEFLEFSSISKIAHEDFKDIITDFSEVRRILARSTEEKQVNYQIKIICKDGTEKWADFTAVVIDWKGQLAVLGTAIDITEQKKAEETLRFQANLLDKIGDLITATDLQGKIIYVNEAETRLLGKQREELIGCSIESFGEDSSRGAKQRDILESTIKNGEWRGEVVNYGKDGKPVILDCRTWIIKDEKDNKVLCGISTDITERKAIEEALKESEEKYRLFFEKSPLGVLHFDKKGVINECNDHFVSIIGSSREALIGLNMNNLPDERIVKAIKKVLQGKPAAFEGHYSSVTADKTTPVRVLFSPIIRKNSEFEGGIGLIEDRSDYIAKEKLEQQVAIAKESAKFKQNFLANMSHEIRTPLTGIMGLIEIMQKIELNQELREYVNILKSSSDNLTEIIDQVLDFSKIEAGKVKLKPRVFTFDSLIKNAQVLFDNLCEKKDIKLRVVVDKRLPDNISADDKRLSQILNNLISNAVKFTDKGQITLKADLVLQESESEDVIIKIEVIDTGIGIPSEKQERLFAPFAQIDEQDTRPYEGTGLGLSICKELVELHGGEIGVKSKLKEGSTFWFTFTAQKAETGKSIFKKFKEKLKEKDVSSKLKILYAEDKVVNQKVVKLMLNSIGHEVILAKDGKEAIELYSQSKFDIILMDIQMPVMDGIKATKELKKKYKKLPPIIGLSANAFEGDREKYMAQGLDEYLTKPVKGEDFVNVLKKFGIA